MPETKSPKKGRSSESLKPSTQLGGVVGGVNLHRHIAMMAGALSLRKRASGGVGFDVSMLWLWVFGAQELSSPSQHELAIGLPTYCPDTGSDIWVILIKPLSAHCEHNERLKRQAKPDTKLMSLQGGICHLPRKRDQVFSVCPVLTGDWRTTLWSGGLLYPRPGSKGHFESFRIQNQGCRN